MKAGDRFSSLAKLKEALKKDFGCTTCGKTGKVADKRCPDCQGKGFMLWEDTERAKDDPES